VFDRFRTRLEFKIVLLITAVLVVVFGTYLVLTIENEAEVLETQQREKITQFAYDMTVGIRNVMIMGKAPLARAFLNEARDSLMIADLTIFDRFGREVFLREGEGIVPNVKDEVLESTLRTHRSQGQMSEDEGQQFYSRYEPVFNRPECWRCHDPKDTLRGVLQIALNAAEASRSPGPQTIRSVGGTMGEFIAIAFRTIMLGGQGEMVDTLMNLGESIPGVVKVQVYARQGYLAFGPEGDELSEEEVLTLLRADSTGPQFVPKARTLRVLIPLANEPKCQVCHGSNHAMRGLMVVEFSLPRLHELAADGTGKRLTEALQSAVLEGFRSIMLVGRASSTRYYLDALRQTGTVRTLRVFDLARNERFLDPPARERPQLPDVVRSLAPLEFTEVVGGEERLVRLTPLLNDQRCFSCHGHLHQVRGVVEVSASMDRINALIAANRWRSAIVGLVTIVLLWLVLRAFMRNVVVKPLQVIEGVAAQVGRGDLSAQTDIRSRDEIGRLAQRINEMVKGLRERFHLQKFVSDQTVLAVRSASLEGLRLGGERKMATVLFSDIRGFTAYAERMDPESVVEKLNDILSRQSSIIRRQGGDIDKYVGDELVAVFEGAAMAEQAVRAALEIQEALSRRPEENAPGLSVGIGINTGEMVMGAMGSLERMDYTVIGDHVNLGARLCAAAAPGQILLSESTAAALAGNESFRLTPLDPLVVKGKQKPITVFAVS